VSESAGTGVPAAAGEGGSVGGAGDGGGYLTHRQVMIVLPGLILTMVLAMLDQLEDAVFLAVLPASIVVFALALFIKQVPLRGRAPSEDAAPATEAGALIG
jgi:hypothetical protein